ncbi:MAG TPA: hypothetical protein DHW78_08340 [Ruminococcaceae bacterium]|jgi:hypothetical protein|nr:hypothetical protein [Oscillospiraceae bacterium]HCM24313.1 hypothetical protein [Oscillospiraceae bacterium]
MANSIEYAKRFMPIVDGIYKSASLTQGMDAAVQPDFSGVDEVRVMKVSTTGLGDYSRTAGYPKGDVSVGWETLKLTEERGKEISIDRMDNEQTLGLAFGTVTGNFMKEHVIPELDAYRFAKYASNANISKATAAVLTKDSVLSAIDEASRQMDADEVPMEGRRLYINSDLKPVLNQAVSRQWGSDNGITNQLSGYNGMPIVYVPSSRFYTGITLNDGSTNWGFAKGTGASNINFLMIYPQAILQVVKFSLPKIFTPDENQKTDSWLFQFREYHDAFVYENKAKGVYLHAKPTA